MDNVTHTLFAATLARTPLERAGRGTTAALIIASNAPDIDIVATAGGAEKYLAWHRGPTHGPIGLVAIAIATAVIVRMGDRALEARGIFGAREESGAGGFSRASLPMLVVVAAIGALLHVLMDLPTVYGTRPLSPFSWRWFAVDWMPIIDIWLLAALAAGLLLGRGSRAARRRNAIIVLTLMAANYGVRAAAHQRAIAMAPRVLGPTMPPPCAEPITRVTFFDSWPRPPMAMPAHLASSRCVVEIAAMPTFLSPFSWGLLVQMSNAYELYDVNLLDPRLRPATSNGEVLWRQVTRFPNVWTPAVERAAATELGQVYLGFSRFPAVRATAEANGVTTVRWQDMRFIERPTASRGGQPVSLFTAIVSVGPDGQILQATLGR